MAGQDSNSNDEKYKEARTVERARTVNAEGASLTARAIYEALKVPEGFQQQQIFKSSLNSNKPTNHYKRTIKAAKKKLNDKKTEIDRISDALGEAKPNDSLTSQLINLAKQLATADSQRHGLARKLLNCHKNLTHYSTTLYSSKATQAVRNNDRSILENIIKASEQERQTAQQTLAELEQQSQIANELKQSIKALVKNVDQHYKIGKGVEGTLTHQLDDLYDGNTDKKELAREYLTGLTSKQAFQIDGSAHQKPNSKAGTCTAWSWAPNDIFATKETLQIDLLNLQDIRDIQNDLLKSNPKSPIVLSLKEGKAGMMSFSFKIQNGKGGQGAQQQLMQIKSMLEQRHLDKANKHLSGSKAEHTQSGTQASIEEHRDPLSPMFVAKGRAEARGALQRAASGTPPNPEQETPTP